MTNIFQRIVWEMGLFLIVQEDISSQQSGRIKSQNKVKI